MVSYRSVLGAGVMLLLATPAFAHPGHGAIHSFSAGLAHPISGADHLLAMVAVGLWAALAAPRLFWVAPGGFMSGMLLGGLAGMAGLVLPSVELIIACSVILFGVSCFIQYQSTDSDRFRCSGLFRCSPRHRAWRGIAGRRRHASICCRIPARDGGPSHDWRRLWAAVAAFQCRAPRSGRRRRCRRGRRGAIGSLANAFGGRLAEPRRPRLEPDHA